MRQKLDSRAILCKYSNISRTYHGCYLFLQSNGYWFHRQLYLWQDLSTTKCQGHTPTFFRGQGSSYSLPGRGDRCTVIFHFLNFLTPSFSSFSLSFFFFSFCFVFWIILSVSAKNLTIVITCIKLKSHPNSLSLLEI